MKKIEVFFLGKIILALLMLSGCVSVPQLIGEKQSPTNGPVDDNQVRIVFMNPSNSIAGAFLSEVYSLEGEDRHLLGMAGSKMKIIADVDPGDHLFMCRTGLRSHFMKAENLEAGKTYYVLMRFIYGAGFQLRPIVNDSASEYSFGNAEFANWNNSTKEMELMPGTEDWINTNWGNHVQTSYDEYWTEWQEKSDAQRDALTLKAGDFAK